jgi:hypothetical protein
VIVFFRSGVVSHGVVLVIVSNIREVKRVLNTFYNNFPVFASEPAKCPEHSGIFAGGREQDRQIIERWVSDPSY